MRKKLYLVLMSVFFASNVFSQSDSLSLKLKKGIYFSHQDYIDNSPSFEKPFKIIPNMVMLNKTDTVLNGYKYALQDTVLKRRKIFAAYDGLHLFIAIKDAFDYYLDNQILMPADSFARFPTLTYTVVVKPISGFSPFFVFAPSSLLITAIGTAVATATKTAKAMSQEEVESYQTFRYLNKRGKPIYPTREAIGFLLHKDKDLELEFSKEKNMTIVVFKKYIRMMNERYPMSY